MSEKEYIFVGRAQLKTRDYIHQIEHENRELKQEIEKLNNILDKINRLFDADTHCENIYHAIGVVLNKEYFDIEDVWEEELLNILNGDDKE